MGDRTEVEADDLDKLTYLTQVRELGMTNRVKFFKLFEGTRGISSSSSTWSRSWETVTIQWDDCMWLLYPSEYKDYGNLAYCT